MALTEQTISKLNHLLGVLETVPKEKFNLFNWARFSYDEMETFKCRHPVRLNGCGMMGCAIGWLASTQQAIDQGLVLIADPYSCYGWVRYTEKKSSESPPYATGFEAIGEQTHGFQAVGKYFGFSTKTSLLLFHDRYYSGVSSIPAVMDRVRLLLEKNDERWFQDALSQHGVEIPA